MHRAPGLFPVLRGLIDRARRDGKDHGLYLLLGSASLDLLKQSGETLAGRVSYLDLGPFDVTEVDRTSAFPDRLWLRGGFPKSFLAPNETRSLRWRQDFIRSYLERDISQFGRRIAAETLRRFWGMLAHHQGGLFNVAAGHRGQGDSAVAPGGGAEIDLLLCFPNGRLWAVEIKRSLFPRPERGFHVACADLNPGRRFLVYPGDETYPLADGIQAVSLPALARQLAGE